jgi:GT2 family glycosyltransferase
MSMEIAVNGIRNSPDEGSDHMSEWSGTISLARKAAVVIPVRNRSDLLKECLSSLAKQDVPIKECEVLICDDCSDIHLEPIVETFKECIPKIRLLRQDKRRGPGAARNMGFRSSGADIFVCIDSDVTCEPHFLLKLLRALELNKDWVAAEATVMPLTRISSPLLDAPVAKGGVYVSAACAYRAEALGQVGGFDENFLLPACEDVDLAMRLLRLGKFGYVPEAAVYHRARRVTLQTHWRWRGHWRYETILAKRYGILAFPGHPAGPFPRLRVAMAAIVTLPAGRLIEGVKYVRNKPSQGMLACLYALFDVFCGFWALPSILFSSVPQRRNYLSTDKNVTL